MRFEYTAIDRGDLAPGHTDSTNYEFAVGGRAYVRSSKTKKRLVTALDGTRRSQLEHISRSWRMTTTKIAEGPDLEQFWEFLDSVADDEPFVWDRASSIIATPVSPLNVILTSTSHSESRILRTPNYRFTLTVQEL